MRLKYTPELSFKHDTTPSRAAHLEAVLDELNDDRNEPGGDPDGDNGRA
jgi:ribosome-binding factor A